MIFSSKFDLQIKQPFWWRDKVTRSKKMRQPRFFHSISELFFAKGDLKIENNNFIYFVKIGTVWRAESPFKKACHKMLHKNSAENLYTKLL
jgi:hypothetical protein